jgi:hypothetical protein
VLRTQQLLSEAQSNPGRLERMAAAARDVALDTFNFEAQMDCFVWSVLMVVGVAGRSVDQQSENGCTTPVCSHHTGSFHPC